jgi:hypothetical protein
MLVDGQWLAAFAFTQAVETPIYAVALRNRTFPMRLAVGFGASLLSHPLVWIWVSAASADAYWEAVVVSEIAAVLAEAAYLRISAVSSALVWSAFANSASAGLGLLARSLWGVP